MHALTRLPVVVLFGVLIAGAFVVAAVLSWISSRTVESDVHSRTSGSVTTVVGVVAGLYAVLVAFVAGPSCSASKSSHNRRPVRAHSGASLVLSAPASVLVESGLAASWPAPAGSPHPPPSTHAAIAPGTAWDRTASIDS